jgi:hypothetical protein
VTHCASADLICGVGVGGGSVKVNVSRARCLLASKPYLKNCSMKLGGWRGVRVTISCVTEWRAWQFATCAAWDVLDYRVLLEANKYRYQSESNEIYTLLVNIA